MLMVVRRGRRVRVVRVMTWMMLMRRGWWWWLIWVVRWVLLLLLIIVLSVLRVRQLRRRGMGRRRL
jgi:hypothetical protein